MLWQYQCQREGTLFYYQHGGSQPPSHLVRHCPVCGSKRVQPAREFPRLNEQGGRLVEGPEPEEGGEA